jgi:polyferredoxin
VNGIATAAGAEPRTATFDLLRVPLIGRFLRWRYSRIAMQIPLAAVAAVMILHAFWGPQLAPKNLAALLSWVHFRGLVVVVILLAGNLFCMACPFLLPRAIARRFFSPRWSWPAALRNKYPAIVLFVGVLLFYELCDLWSDPYLTGALIVGYFAAALAVDAVFSKASFCKYVCPIGQFNFVASTLSPLEVTVRDHETCTGCRDKNCIRGTRDRSAAPPGTVYNRLPVIQRGCELALFAPKKVGNLDCTMCLDCVYACPHDNIAITARVTGAELAEAGPRSGVGAIERRTDWTVLMVVFTFGAVLNAFAMISPVYTLEQWAAKATGLRVEWPILGALFTLALIVEPALLLGGAAAVSRRALGARERLLPIIKRYAPSLVPIGFGMWLAHYGFHFFTGALTIVPVTQNAVARATGRSLLGEPLWHWGGLSERVVFPLEMGFLGLGLIGSWVTGWVIARQCAGSLARRAFVPWAIVHLLLFVSAVWIMTQPMDMRGTFLGG